MVDMKDFQIENEYRAETAKKWRRFVQSDLHIFIRVGHHRIRMADKRIVADVFAKAGDTHGPNVIGFVVSAPMRHMKTDDWGMLLESAYDRELLHFINNTMENMVTLWSFNVGQDVEIHKLTHLYF